MATFRDLAAYLERDGWVEERSLARGKRRIGDHRRYTKELAGGAMLRTKVSHALGNEIGVDLFRHILREQLQVVEAHFWAVVRGQVHDASDAPPPPMDTVPAWLVQRLLFTVGMSEADVRAMTKVQALERWNAFVLKPMP